MVLADEAQIKILNEQIDGFRDATLEPLEHIVSAHKEEQVAAAKAFDATVSTVLLIAVILTIIGVMVAAVLAFIITRGITKHQRKLWK